MYYFERRVPRDLQAHYSKPKIVRSLRTRDLKQASQMADQLSQRLASHWEGLRTDLLSGWISGKQIPPVRHETPFKPISLRDAHRMYIEVKGRENDLKFCQSVERSVKEYGLAITNVFNGTFIPEDNKRKERLPVPVDVIRRIQGEC